MLVSHTLPPSRLPFWFPCPLRWGGLLQVAPGLDMDHKVNDWWQFLWPSFHHDFLHANHLLHHQVPHTQSMCLPTSMFVVFIHFLLYFSIISTKLSEYWLHTPHVFEVIVVNMCCTRCTQALLLPGWSPCSMAKGAMACVTLQCLWHATFVESLLVVRKAANS